MYVLDQLKKFTRVVADSGDFCELAKHSPLEATTNPSLILKACLEPKNEHLINLAIRYAKQHARDKNEELQIALEKLLVNFALQISLYVPGRISIEVDARDSYDTKKTIEKAKRLVSLAKEAKIPSKKILIKLAATWEGILAAQYLEKEKIHCNMTLIFSLSQALACAQAQATLISPFVGRVLDWYKKQNPSKIFLSENDPGVLLVKEIYLCLKKFDYRTEIMGASFRNIDQIIALCGCDLLTISLPFLEELSQKEKSLQRQLHPILAKQSEALNPTITKEVFKESLEKNPMAKEKLFEGIALFSQDTAKLEKILLSKLS